MQLNELYPLKGFTLTQIVETHSGKVLLKAVSSSRSAVCPYCQTRSQKRHSVYVRKPQALPCSDTPIQLVLSVHRYLCHNPSCTRKTFAERIPDTAHFYARRTIHLECLLRWIAFEMSAETASRICERLQVQVSLDTVLRLIRKTDLCQGPTVRVLGVDDWATKKGQSYGTILVDLEKRRTIELLPDRTQTTLSQWLQKHPEVELISRDRSFEYKAVLKLVPLKPSKLWTAGICCTIFGKNCKKASLGNSKGRNRMRRKKKRLPTKSERGTSSW